MSEELRKGIPKGRITGHREMTKEEKELADRKFEEILKAAGVLKDNETIKDLEHPK